MTIQKLQQWVADDWEKYPKNKPNIEQQVLLIVEELGEVAEALRKMGGRKDRTSKEVHLGSEFADLVVSIVTLANTYDVNLSFEIEEFQERLQSRHDQGF